MNSSKEHCSGGSKGQDVLYMNINKWYDLPSVIYTIDYVVTDSRCIKVIRDMNITTDKSRRKGTICGDDAYFETPDEEYFREVWYAKHPGVEMIPDSEMELCSKKALGIFMESPFKKLSTLCRTCAELAYCIEFASDAINAGEFGARTVIEEMSDYYEKLFA